MTRQQNPFPGLRSFKASERSLFFGREESISSLVSLLQDSRFITVTGTSGSGKTSLIRCGLIPECDEAFRAKGSWSVAMFRPGKDFFGNMAVSLLQSGIFVGSSALPKDGAALGRELADTGPDALVQSLVTASKPGCLLMVVDQFEEIFRQQGPGLMDSQGNAAGSLVDFLLGISSQNEAPVYVLLTMRSEYLGMCTQFPGLAEAINRGAYLIPRLTRSQRRLAITGPVALRNAVMAESLVARLLDDVGDNPDQLPILQHALMRLWDYWSDHGGEGEPLDLHHYHAVGTLGNAMNRHAEEAFLESTDERDKLCVQKVFTSLIESSGDGAGARRSAGIEEICAMGGITQAEVIQVAERFRRPGRSFLMPSSEIPLKASTVLDISHESLMRVWVRLGEWVKADARSAELYRRLAQAAGRYQSGDAGLWRDPELQLALRWRQEHQPTAAWAERHHPAFERTMLFLETSAEARDGEISRKERNQRRQLKRFRLLAAFFSVAFFMILYFFMSAVALRKKAEASAQAARNNLALAEAEKAEAQRQRSEAQRAKAQADKERKRAQNNAEVAIKGQIEAQIQRSAALEARDQARENLARALDSEEETQRLLTLQLARRVAAQVSVIQRDDPDLAALNALQAYRFAVENSVSGPSAEIQEGLRLASAALELPLDELLAGAGDAIWALTQNPRRKALYFGGDDGVLSVMALDGAEEQIRRFPSVGQKIRSLVFHPRNDILIIGTAEGTIYTHFAEKTTEVFLNLPGQSVTALAFNASGTLLAAALVSGEIRVWQWLEREPLVQLTATNRNVWDVAFSPDGELAAGLGSGGLLRWRPGEKEGRVSETDRNIRCLVYSGDGSYLALGESGGSVVLISQDSSEPPLLLNGHLSSINDLIFTRDGKSLLSAGSDATVRQWSLDNPDLPPVVLGGHQSWVLSLSLSADGERLFSAGADKQLRSWTLSPGHIADALCKHLGRNMTTEEWTLHMGMGIPYRKTCPESLPATEAELSDRPK